jgi:hypothetical protein
MPSKVMCFSTIVNFWTLDADFARRLAKLNNKTPEEVMNPRYVSDF